LQFLLSEFIIHKKTAQGKFPLGSLQVFVMPQISEEVVEGFVAFGLLVKALIQKLVEEHWTL